MLFVLPGYDVTWTTDDEATQTVAGIEHTLRVWGEDDLAKLLTIIARNSFRSLTVEPYSVDQVTNG